MSTLKKNLSFALFAQLLATAFSVLMYLLVPKVMGTESYGYWQLYLLYTNYSGFFHLGLCDGVYLRLGGRDFNSLNYSLLGTQLKFLTIILVSLTSLFYFLTFFFHLPSERRFVILFFVIYTIFYCIHNFLGFIFQAVNKTQIYSLSVIVEKTISLFGVILLIALKVRDYRYYIAIAVFSIALNAVYLIIKARVICFSKLCSFKIAFAEMCSNISVGCILMFAGIASTLIIGIIRMLIDSKWGIDVFGKFSFAISMINMLLLFIRQVSLVLFPALRRINDEERSAMYVRLLEYISIVLPAAYLLYAPVKAALSLWLPQYLSSFKYFGLLMPVCLFEGKTQMIFNTFYKVIRKEKVLLFVNLFSLFVSFLLGSVACFICDNITLAAVVIVVVMATRSIVSEIYISDFFHVHIDFVTILYDLITASAVMVCVWYFNDIVTFSVTLLSLALFLFIRKKKVINLFGGVKNYMNC